MRYGILLCAVAFASVGCQLGKKAENIGVAQYPAGAMANVALAEGTINGELFAVEETGLVLLRSKTLTVVPYASIRHVTFPELGNRYLVGQHQPSATTLREMRLISHFPQGIPVAARSTLQSMYATDTLSR